MRLDIKRKRKETRRKRKRGFSKLERRKVGDEGRVEWGVEEFRGWSASGESTSGEVPEWWRWRAGGEEE